MPALRSRIAPSAFAVALSVACIAGTAHADENVELRYARLAGTEQCPEASSLRSLVLEHLGYDPFVTRGTRVIAVTLSRGRGRGHGRSGHGLHAQIDSLDPHGVVVGARSLDSPSTDCTELVSSVALAVSIAIDPLHAAAAPAPPAPSPVARPAPPPPPVQEQPLPPVPQPPSPPLADTPEPAPGPAFTPMVSAAFVSALGSAPAVSFGGAAELRLRAGSTSLGLGARADAPASATAHFSSGTGSTEGARVQSSLLVATVVPCWHRGVIALCVVADLGALAGTSTHVQISERQSTFFSSAGGRVALAWPVGSYVLVGAHAEALAILTPTTLRIDHQDAWSTSPVAGDLGLQVSVQFP